MHQKEWDGMWWIRVVHVKKEQYRASYCSIKRNQAKEILYVRRIRPFWSRKLKKDAVYSCCKLPTYPQNNKVLRLPSLGDVRLYKCSRYPCNGVPPSPYGNIRPCDYHSSSEVSRLPQHIFSVSGICVNKNSSSLEIWPLILIISRRDSQWSRVLRINCEIFGATISH